MTMNRYLGHTLVRYLKFKEVFVDDLFIAVQVFNHIALDMADQSWVGI